MKINFVNLLCVGTVMCSLFLRAAGLLFADGCGNGYFACHDDCCKKGTMFCNEHPTERRCQGCDLQRDWCGTDQEEQHCTGYCLQFKSSTRTTGATTTTADSTPPTSTSGYHNDINGDTIKANFVAAVVVVITLFLVAMAFFGIWCLIRLKLCPLFIRKLFVSGKQQEPRKEGSDRGASFTLSDTSATSSNVVQMHSTQPLVQEDTAERQKETIQPGTASDEETASLLGIATNNSSQQSFETVDETVTYRESERRPEDVESQRVEEARVQREASGGGRHSPGRSQCSSSNSTAQNTAEGRRTPPGQDEEVTTTSPGQPPTAGCTQIVNNNITITSCPLSTHRVHPGSLHDPDHGTDSARTGSNGGPNPPESYNGSLSNHGSPPDATSTDINVNNGTVPPPMTTTSSSSTATPSTSSHPGYMATGSAVAGGSATSDGHHQPCRDLRLYTTPTNGGHENADLAIDVRKPTGLFFNRAIVQQESGQEQMN